VSFADRGGVRGFLSFLGGSAAGLAIDLTGFWLLSHAANLPPAFANVISSVVSVTVVYLLVTRYSFGVGVRPSTYVFFVGWYLLNISVFSWLIGTMSAATGVEPFVWKLASVPISFVANYAFSRLLFRNGQSRQGPSPPDESP